MFKNVFRRKGVQYTNMFICLLDFILLPSCRQKWYDSQNTEKGKIGYKLFLKVRVDQYNI